MMVLFIDDDDMYLAFKFKCMFFKRIHFLKISQTHSTYIQRGGSGWFYAGKKIPSYDVDERNTRKYKKRRYLHSLKGILLKLD